MLRKYSIAAGVLEWPSIQGAEYPARSILWELPGAVQSGSPRTVSPRHVPGAREAWCAVWQG